MKLTLSTENHQFHCVCSYVKTLHYGKLSKFIVNMSKFQFCYSYAVILINIYFFNCNFHEIIPKIVILVYSCKVFYMQHMH